MTAERQVVLVTGASRGIGRAVALAYGNLGAHVVVNGFRSAEGGSATPPPEVAEDHRRTPAELFDADGAADHPVDTAAPESDDPPEDAVVAVVGMGLVVPGADDTEEFWRLLTHPRDVFTEPGNRFTLSDFWSADRSAPDRTYARVAGYVPDDTGDLEVDWLRRATREAMSGVTLDPGDRRAAFLGAWPGGSQASLQTAVVEAVAAGATDPDTVRAALRAHLPYAVTPPRDARPEERIRRGLDGAIADSDPVVIVDTACASSLNAVDLAAGHLLSGRCDLALCGGLESLDPTNAVLFAKLGGLSPTGAVRAFDAAADGTLFSDGAAVLVLKTLARAQADGDQVLGVLDGFGSAADGRGRSIAAPNPAGQRRALLRARAVNGLSATDVDWVVAHATGTTAGDRSELETIAQNFGDGCPVSATKAVVGHTGWAAGVTAVIHALLALRAGTVPPQYRFDHLPEEMSAVPVRIPRSPWSLPTRASRPRTVGVSAFGFGGTNAHLLVSDRAARPRRRCRPPEIRDDIVVVGWSAHLPGLSDRDAVRAWLVGGGPGPQRSFGQPYPLPSPLVTRLPGRTSAGIDPGQVMALDVAHRFVEENGELWRSVADTTGVFATHAGVPYLLTECALRCYAQLLRTAADGAAPAVRDAVDRRLATARRRLASINEDTQPGVLPNVLASRLAQRYDLHGPMMVLDGGRDSALWAVEAACDQLRQGALNLALVLAVDATSTPEAALMADVAADGLAEGAVLIGLARRRVAEREGWPLLGRLEPERAGPPADGPPGPSLATDTVRRPTVDSALELVRAVENHASQVLLAGRPSAPVVRVCRPAVDQRLPAALTQRYVPTLRTRYGSPADGPSLPTGGVLLTDLPTLDADLLSAAAASDTVILSSHHAPRTPVRSGSAAEPLDRMLDGRRADVRIVVGGEDQEAVRGLHDLTFRTLQRLLSGDGAATLGAVLPAGAPPSTGLFTGLARAVVLEYPATRTAVVLTDAPDQLAALSQVSAELGRAGITVAHRSGAVRRVEVLVPAPLPAIPPGAPALLLPQKPVIVASGGTSGLATVLLTALRSERQPTLWVLGSSDLRDLERWAHLPDGATAARRELIRQLVRDGAGLPEAVVTADGLLLRRRAAHQLGRLREAFGPTRVHYVTCDVTDPMAVHAAADQVYRQHDHVDLMLHAAGRSSPHALHRKELSEFRRLRDVKIEGHRNLRSAFDRPPPRLWCNVGSLIGAFGEAGDPDYASGNDVLGRAGRDGWRHHRGEVTIGFPLWNEAGLAGPGTLMSTYLARRQLLTAVSNAEGIAQFRTELRHLRAGGGASFYAGDIERARFGVAYPGYVEVSPAAYLRTPARVEDGGTVWDCPLDEVSDGYLHDHLVASRATLPGTFMLEMAAEAALALLPGYRVHGFRDCSFDRFVRPFTGRFPSRLRIRAENIGPTAAGAEQVRVELLSVVPELGAYRSPVHHFSALVCLGREAAPPQHAVLTPDAAALPTVDPYYEASAGVALRGFFANTTDPRGQADGGQSVWRLPEVDVDALAGLAVPALLICATMRTAALVRTAADGSPGTFAPRRIARIDLPGEQGNDLSWAARQPAGIRLTGAPSADRFEASTMSGELVLRVCGVQLVEIERNRV